MKQEEANKLIELIDTCLSVDKKEVLQKLFPDSSTAGESLIVTMTIEELFSLSTKLLVQLKDSLSNRSMSILLPVQYAHPTLGNHNLSARLTEYNNSLTNVEPLNINKAEEIIIWLGGYGIEYGILSFYSDKIADVVIDQKDKIVSDLQVLQNNLQNEIKKSDSLNKDLSGKRDEIESLITQKKSELDIIKSNLETSNTHVSQIAELLTNATENGATISSLLEQQKENKSEFDESLEEFQEMFKNKNDELNLHSTQIKKLLESFSKSEQNSIEHLKYIEGKKEFFDERNEYLDELIGREVGASLFETFKQRKRELESSVKFWTYAVPIMAVLSIAWIFFLFYSAPDTTSINKWWQYFAVNTIKSFPAVILLLFTINQYRKERSFQEEYAFKSAVALTIKAYADQLKEESNKDKLILDSVLNVYTSPIEKSENSKRYNKQTNRIIDKALGVVDKFANGNK